MNKTTSLKSCSQLREAVPRRVTGPHPFVSTCTFWRHVVCPRQKWHEKVEISTIWNLFCDWVKVVGRKHWWIPDRTTPWQQPDDQKFATTLSTHRLFYWNGDEDFKMAIKIIHAKCSMLTMITCWCWADINFRVQGNIFNLCSVVSDRERFENLLKWFKYQ